MLLSRYTRCPLKFPAGYYWYGNKHKGQGRPPKWVNDPLTTSEHKEICQSHADAQETDVESHDQSEEAEEPEVNDSNSETVQTQEHKTEIESIPERDGTKRYGLRQRVSPPTKLIQIGTCTPAQNKLDRKGGVMKQCCNNN